MGRLVAGEARDNKCCVGSMLVTKNKKVSNGWPLSCHSTPLYGRGGFKRISAEQHAFIRRVVRTQEVQKAEDMV